MDPIGWGVLATGAIARTVASDISRASGCQLVAVASRSEERARDFAAAFGAHRAYGSYEALVADPAVDVVYVATPHGRHHHDVSLSFDAGKAVLCEKALTLNAADAADLIETARARRLFFMEAMWMRCNPSIRAIQQTVSEGAIGQVRYVGADLGFVAEQGPEHRLFDPALGASALLDVGIYPLTFASLFLGVPDRTESVGTLSDRGIDLACTSALRYDAALAHVSCSLLATMSGRATVGGSAGRIDVPAPFHHPQEFTVHRGDQATTYRHPLAGNGYIPEIDEVNRCLREGRTESPLVPLDDTLRLMHQLDRMRSQVGARLPGDPKVRS